VTHHFPPKEEGELEPELWGKKKNCKGKERKLALCEGIRGKRHDDLGLFCGGGARFSRDGKLEEKCLARCEGGKWVAVLRASEGEKGRRC